MKRRTQALVTLAIIAGHSTQASIPVQNYVEKTQSNIFYNFSQPQNNSNLENKIIERPTPKQKGNMKKVNAKDTNAAASPEKVVKEKQIHDQQLEQNYDSLYNISQKLRELLEEQDEGNMNKFYGQDQYIEQLTELENKFKTEVKKLKLNETVLKCGEKEFEERMNVMKQTIKLNPEKYGGFNGNQEFIINKKEFENLLKETFPEFYSLPGGKVDNYLEMRDRDTNIDKFEKYQGYDNCNDIIKNIVFGFMAGFVIILIILGIFIDKG